MKAIQLLASLLATAALMGADPETLPTLKVSNGVGSETYRNVTVTSVTATHIYFSHSLGMGIAKLKDLEPDMQKHFQFDPAKAEAAQKQQAQDNALYRQDLEQKAAAQRRTPAARPEAQAAPGASGEVPPHPIYAKSFLNQRAPTLLLEKWLTPEPDATGKFVLVDFWATWCGPCRASIPHLNTLSGRFKDRLVVIGLSDEPEQVVRKMTDPAIEYSVAIDTEGRTSKAIQVQGIPHAMLIDPKGIVRFEGLPQYLNEQNLAALLDRYGQ
jgi:thiol-disulfide isomerase/thioredoxin